MSDQESDKRNWSIAILVCTEGVVPEKNRNRDLSGARRRVKTVNENRPVQKKQG